MAFTSGTMPNLLGGVSQQPFILRHPTQLEDQRNMVTSLVEGLTKRPPMEHYDYLGDDKITTNTAFFHWIDRDPTERYLLILKSNTTPIVYDIVNKTFETVNAPNGTAYLTATTPRTAFRAVTVADHTFIVNTEVEASTISTCTTSATGTITFTGLPSDTETIRISDGYRAVIFEFESAGGWTAGRTGVTIGVDAANTAEQLKLAIEASGLLITVERADGVLTLTNDQMGTKGNQTIVEAATNVTASGFSGGTGDPESVRSPPGDIGAIVTVAVPANDTQYDIHDEQFGGIATFTSSASGVVQANTIAGELADDINAFGSDFVAYDAGKSNIFIYRRADTTDHDENLPMNLSVFSSNTVGGLQLVDKQVQSFTDLPINGRRHVIVEVTGDPGTPFDNYYVRSQAPGSDIIGQAFAGEGIIGDIVWEETVAPLIQYRLDPATMPHLLVREADGSFTFEQAEWSNRACGDEDTNPWPSFVDATINDVFFFKNRLGFLSGENCILSEVGQYFNFFRTTATTQLDTDPVDVTVSTNEVAILHHAVLSGKRLFAFSDKLQFELAGDPLTPSSAALVNVARYSAKTGVSPVVGGDAIYFAFDRGTSFSGIREMIPSSTEDDETTDITSHAPMLLEGGIDAMTWSLNESSLYVHTQTDGHKKIFVYKTHWEDTSDGREKVVSSWGHWTFPLDILHIKVLDEHLYAVMFDNTSDRLFLERMDLREGATEASDWDWKVLLDLRLLVTDDDVSAVYSAPNTTITLPFRGWNESNTPVELFDLDTLTHSLPVSANPTTGEVVVAGDVTADNLLIGFRCSALVEFSTPVPRTRAGERSVPLPDGDLYILFWSVNFANSGRVRGRVTLPDGTLKAYTHIADVNDEEGGLKTGRLKFPVRAKADGRTVIDFINDKPYPSHLINAGWEGNFILRSR